MSQSSIPHYSPESPPNSPPLNSHNESRSPWSGSAGSDYDSLGLPPLQDHEFDFDLEQAAQYFDTDPRLSTSDDPFLDEPEPEPSTSRSQEQQEQLRLPHILRTSSYNFDDFAQGSEGSPDPFFDLSGYTPPRTPDLNSNTDLDNNFTRGVVDLTESSPQPEDMSLTRKRKATATPSDGRAAKVTRPTARPRTSRKTPVKIQKVEEAEVVDLVDIEDDSQYESFKKKQQEELIKQQQQDEANKPVKLAEFQCIICMDNPTDLTVTHCGHLFCSECLHQALWAGNAKKSCPVCRTAIVMPRPSDKKPSKNGFFALEMRLMTANKKGKQPVRVR